MTEKPRRVILFGPGTVVDFRSQAEADGFMVEYEEPDGIVELRAHAGHVRFTMTVRLQDGGGRRVPTLRRILQLLRGTA